MQPLPHPEGNGTRPVSPARQPETPAPGPGRRAASAVSRWWRMGRRSMGCSGSSAAPEGTPPGPATVGCWSAAAPGLDRRQRRPRPTGSGRPGHRRRHPPGRPGHAGRIERRRRRGHPPGRPGRCQKRRRHARPGRSSPPGHDGSTRRPHRSTSCNGNRQPRAASAARRASTGGSGTVGARLQAAYAQPRPDGQPWTARTLAEAAGCGRSSAAAFLQRQRPPATEPPP
jgi:hypothetical protein